MLWYKSHRHAESPTSGLEEIRFRGTGLATLVTSSLLSRPYLRLFMCIACDSDTLYFSQAPLVLPSRLHVPISPCDFSSHSTSSKYDGRNKAAPRYVGVWKEYHPSQDITPSLDTAKITPPAMHIVHFRFSSDTIPEFLRHTPRSNYESIIQHAKEIPSQGSPTQFFILNQSAITRACCMDPLSRRSDPTAAPRVASNLRHNPPICDNLVGDDSLSLSRLTMSQNSRGLQSQRSLSKILYRSNSAPAFRPTSAPPARTQTRTVRPLTRTFAVFFSLYLTWSTRIFMDLFTLVLPGVCIQVHASRDVHALLSCPEINNATRAYN